MPEQDPGGKDRGLQEEELVLLVALRSDELNGPSRLEGADRWRLDDLEARATAQQLDRVESWARFGIDIYALNEDELALMALTATDIIRRRMQSKESGVTFCG